MNDFVHFLPGNIQGGKTYFGSGYSTCCVSVCASDDDGEVDIMMIVIIFVLSTTDD